MKYITVPKDEVDAVWPHIEEWVGVSRGVNHSFSVDDIKQLCRERADLWVILDGDEYKGFFIGMVSVRPQGKIYHGAWLGGKDLALWVNGLKVIEAWARENGYMGCSFIGRPAWKKLVGYDYEAAYYYKNLN